MGLTTVVEPVPIKVPPQDPVYQFQDALVPNEPPATVRLTKSPEQTELFDAKDPDGSEESVSNETVVEAQLVVLHVPFAKTK